MNPIRNLLHMFEEFLRMVKYELVDGIVALRDRADIAKCHKHMNHLRKVIPRVIEGGGAATCY